MPIPMLFAAMTICTLTIMSAVLAVRGPGTRKLPIRWDSNGQPTWTAPRGAALAALPVAASAVLTLVLFPAVAQTSAVTIPIMPLVLAICAAFIMAHGAYSRALFRWNPAAKKI